MKNFTYQYPANTHDLVIRALEGIEQEARRELRSMQMLGSASYDDRCRIEHRLDLVTTALEALDEALEATGDAA